MSPCFTSSASTPSTVNDTIPHNVAPSSRTVTPGTVARAVRAGLSEEEQEEREGEENGGGEDIGGGDRRALPADTRRRAPTKEDLADRRYDRDLLRSFDERLKEREAERREGVGKEGERRE